MTRRILFALALGSVATPNPPPGGAIGFGALNAIRSPPTTSARPILSPRRPAAASIPFQPPLCRGCAAPLRFSLGNVSVPWLLDAWGNSPLLPTGTDLSPAAHSREVADYVAKATANGVSSLEDYIGWGVAEPSKDLWQWDLYREGVRTIEASGIGYTAYIWVHILPTWTRNDPSFVRARCLEHHQPSEGSLSIFSVKTEEAYDRVYSQLRSQFGDELTLLRFGTPNDFGEAGYPSGVAIFAFPDEHIHLGFWVDEPEARAHFANAMAAKYRTIERLNAAWSTQFYSFTALDYPTDASQPRRWLDFVGWYHDARTERIGVLMDVARRHFPNTPISLNFGFPDERISYGQDPTGLTRMLAAKGFQSRSPNGYPVPFLNTKRLATAARLYKTAGFATEPANDYDGSSDVVSQRVAESLFRDLTMGVSLHFDYANNYEQGRAAIAEALSARRGDYPGIDTALFFSTTAHRLDMSRDPWGFRGYPDGLVKIADDLRDILDYDVLDERLLDDGFLDRYNVLIWPLGMTTEARTLRVIRDWIERGGILIVGNLASVRTVQGDPGALSDIPAGPGLRTRVSKGFVLDLAGDGNNLGSLITSRSYVTPDVTPVAGPFLAPLDTAVDGVLVSQFETGILLYNRSDVTVVKSLSMPPGTWRYIYGDLPPSVTLPPGAVRWLDGKSGKTN